MREPRPFLQGIVEMLKLSLSWAAKSKHNEQRRVGWKQLCAPAHPQRRSAKVTILQKVSGKPPHPSFLVRDSLNQAWVSLRLPKRDPKHRTTPKALLCLKGQTTSSSLGRI